ncbi:structural protein [Pseudomaricurvus alkylphenolicus]|uniref:structural protein n=1 Tax=Pseudomaricurvus alkylphenolicus TaxID=1306991 RepID=UPI0014241886|nr:structural protein [Pseudomaricurvus alkylphenolicus]NIB44753.1 structural protein [Pseudomaricurvus alkylphenolicus]
MLVPGNAATRGIRNHNWLNIRYNEANDWDGQTGPDAEGFAKFQGPEWGIRAAAKLLVNYQDWYGINTVKEIVERWAPAADDNDTVSYIRHVSDVLGVHPMEAFDVRERLQQLLEVMALHESGALPIGAEQVIYQGINMAGVV